jgi:5-methylcytosine-specific restriction endonuclease McrA
VKLTKAQRELIRQKYDGRCAYCGQQLGVRWHADHFEPIRRNTFGNVARPLEHPERDCLENMMPSCAPCNIDKHSFDLETWRRLIQNSNEVLKRDVSTFRRSIRYGLVSLNEVPVIFYFETIDLARSA